MIFHIVIVPFLILAIVDCKSDRKRHSGRRIVQADNTIKTIGDLCELEISCKDDAAISGTKVPVNVPIRGPRGPAGRAGRHLKPGKSGILGTPGLPAEENISCDQAFLDYNVWMDERAKNEESMTWELRC